MYRILCHSFSFSMTDEGETPVAPTQPILQTDDISSFLDLRTEFIRRRDAAYAGKQPQSEPALGYMRSKSNILTVSKEERKTKMEISSQRVQRIRANEEVIRKEEQERIRQKRILEEKASIYERMAKGEKLVYEDGNEADFLVDFHAKRRELEEEEHKKPRAAEDDTVESTYKPQPMFVHYDHTEDKGRVFGASHVPLPTMDEDAREKKIAELKAMTEETIKNRAEKKKQKNAEKTVEKKRLNRMRIRLGMEPLPSSDEETEEVREEVDLSDIPLPSTSSSEANRAEEPEQKKPKHEVREWDRGKIGYTRWIEAQREEREDEFRPPEFYFEESKKGNSKRNI